ncbi:predicted protein [Candida tropicalis MYA-3404]|uniref:Uncharacterized protein n=1 Tax=Candida tropicalis (strain ATCC MYA-3404 / T1) TaxID=294747 RepID=C5M4Z0_CANTT|nr:predicted protein [Candida tropicalis MYA-3404]EER35106.1 predicted protein [Candida tropicalis MYA-3404]KAG4408993.1 hypothetical protein JTP64_002299 [Candida tropicalis]
MSPQLSSTTIETIKSSSELYNNVKFNKLIVFSNNNSNNCLSASSSSSSSSFESSQPSSSREDFQLIGSLNLSTCQPLSEEFCSNIQTELKNSLLKETTEEELKMQKEKISNKVVYFHDNEDHKMIGHFINKFIIVYIDVL